MVYLVTGLLIMSGIAAFLALIVEIAGAFLADYGEVHILINQEKDISVKGGSPLLFTLMEQGIFIPSACGGKGTCSLCKLKVLQGGGPVLPTETPYLTPQEITGNVRLSCQVKVRNDLAIQIPEEIFLIKEYRVRVKEVKDLTPRIRSIRFKVLEPEEGITFKAGQYVQLQVPKYKKTSGAEYRAYSIVSPPEEHQELELLITKVPEGAVSTYVHEYLKVGDELRATGPYGEFYLRESDRDILFIATGSGLAPILSILQQMEREGIHRKATLFYGARTIKDLLYRERLTALEKELPEFTYVPTLSRSQEGDGWSGEKGRVTHLIRNYIPDRAEIDVYMCGSPAMIDSCLALLREKGIPEGNIFFDKFE